MYCSLISNEKCNELSYFSSFFRLSMTSSGPELDLELLTSRKDKVVVPKGIHTPMFYCGDNCKLVKCNILGYYYGMRFFMCVNYEHDPLPPRGNIRPKVRTNCITK
jgi:hypothetical protein